MRRDITLYYLNNTHQLTINVVASKCGFAAFEDGAVTNSPEHIKSYIDGTIERLGFAPDLYYLHRIDPSMCFHPPFSFDEYRFTDSPNKIPPSNTRSQPSTQSAKPARPNTSVYLSVPPQHSVRQTPVRPPYKPSHLPGKTRKTMTKPTDTTLIVAKIDAVQAEYSAFETLHETDGLIATARELNIAYVAYSPLGHGWLVDDFPYESPDDFAPDDFRRTGKLLSLPLSIFIANHDTRDAQS